MTMCKAHSKVTHTLYLVFGVNFPLSAEAVIKFGPMHIPIASKGHAYSLVSCQQLWIFLF